MTIEIDSIPGSPVIGALNGDITDLETDVIVNSANTKWSWVAEDRLQEGSIN